MSPDLDDALRASMRRHAEDAPTSIDTEAIRMRAKGIQRRRTLESVAAVVVLLGVVLGLGALVGTLRNDATPPPAVTQTPVPASGPLMAFTSSKDGNTPLGIVVRSGGTDTVVTAASDFNGALTLVGWYGPDHRTLVWGVAGNGLRAATLYAVTIGADGRPAESPHPLRIPNLPVLGRGVAFPVAGTDGPLQFWVPSDPSGMRGTSALLTIAPDLASGVTRPLPNGLPVSANLDAPGPLVPIAVTASEAVLVGIDSGRVGVSTLTADGATHPAKTSACTPRLAEATNLRGAVALGCIDGSVDLLTPADGNVTHLAQIPEAAEPGLLLGLWWDPIGGLHASTTPEGRADYTVVHDWDWTGKAWVRSSDEGVLTRIYPVGSPSVRLVKKNDLPGNLGRWIVESNPEVDLGQTDGALVVAPVIAAAPTASPQPTGSAPATTLGWTATVRSFEGGAGQEPSEQVWVSIDGQSRMVADAGNAATSVLGWYGPDHRTLVWQSGQDLLQLRAVTFAADGSVDGTPHDLEVSGVSSPLLGMATAIPGAGLVLWHQKPGTSPPAYEMVRLDESLALHSTTPDNGGSLVFATGTAYATTATGKQPTEEFLLSTSGLTTPIRLLQNCSGDLSGVPSPDGSKVALLCRGSATGQQNHVELLDLVANRSDDRVLPAGDVVLWWDPAGSLHASVDGVPSGGASAPTTVRWVLSAGSWVDDPGQTADLRVFPLDGPALSWTRDGAAGSGIWATETDPSTVIGPGLPSPVYSIGTGNIAVRPTS